ncbi:hypothetical protein [Frigoriglobus tundricola]|uniref:hypothetical protein n=1 Tax=Frigoriglobus tundricola TaxID=2774151 RepID=UPI00148EC1A6|nr:hypothetical protein [Frigoriglobus tundricola]
MPHDPGHGRQARDHQAVVLVGTWSLFRQSHSRMFDGVPDNIDLSAVVRYLETLPGVERVHDLHV